MRRDTRRDPRFVFKGNIALSWDERGNPRFGQGKCLDISEHGMRIETPYPIEARSFAVVRLENTTISGHASVRYCRRDGSKYLLGLEFTSSLDLHKLPLTT